MSRSPAWIDGALYPDVDPPERLEDLADRVDFLARLCAAWDFGVLPEIEFSVRRQITPSFTFTVGYTLIFLSDAIRLGDQIDITVNSSDLPVELPLARESGAQSGQSQRAGLDDSSLWVQGIHVGLQW